jgi:hypothetical protein
MSAPPVLLPFNVLQPQKISANGSAPARGTENQDDPAAATVQPPAATTDIEIQVDLTPGATIRLHHVRSFHAGHRFSTAICATYASCISFGFGTNTKCFACPPSV